MDIPIPKVQAEEEKRPEGTTDPGEDLPDLFRPDENITHPSPDGHRPVSIFVDHREGRGGVLQALLRMGNIDVSFGTLGTGDYRIDNRFLVERKTLPDLVQSILDGRLFRQAKKLADHEIRGAIILEGHASDLEGRLIRRESIQGALIAVSVLLGVPILRSRDPEETARLMLMMAHQAERTVSGGLLRHGRRPRRHRALQLHLLQGLPGIGPGKARGLLETFGSVEAVVRADADALARSPGIGKTLARRIRWALGPPAPFPCPLPSGKQQNRRKTR
ncbi:MAG: nuclease [Acidobacteria bacterium]|nr:nuclease [Acidobacteriota bacterium]